MPWLERTLNDKKILWIGKSNRYLLLEYQSYEVIKLLLQGISPGVIRKKCCESFGMSVPAGRRFVEEIRYSLEKEILPPDIIPGSLTAAPTIIPAPPAFSHRYYKICEHTISVKYGSVETEFLVHHKLAHLEIEGSNGCDSRLEAFQYKNHFFLKVNGTLTGQWRPEETSLFCGKVTMEMLNCIYHKTDDDWFGVFHASAVGNQKCCIMFPGNSGNGKSTLSAILMSYGYDLMNDDFVPVDSASGMVCSFPAALSVKQKAIDCLLPLFPELALIQEFSYLTRNKMVRYLPPHPLSPGTPGSLPCKALVFVKYQDGCSCSLEPLSREIAFQNLIPDSWLSPLPTNAGRFLDWFLAMPCYRLTYSDNEQMVQAIQKLFCHE